MLITLDYHITTSLHPSFLKINSNFLIKNLEHGKNSNLLQRGQLQMAPHWAANGGALRNAISCREASDAVYGATLFARVQSTLGDWAYTWRGRESRWGWFLKLFWIFLIWLKQGGESMGRAEKRVALCRSAWQVALVRQSTGTNY